jgi:hypothetical protein
VETVMIAGGQTLDLCPSHRDDLAPFLALIAEWGASSASTGRKRATAPAPMAAAPNGNTPKKRGGKRARERRATGDAVPASDAPLSCPLCERTSPNGDALSSHLRTMHDTTSMAVFGGTCPVCNHAGDARGLGTHARKAHEAAGTAALFALAQSQGDPHGVIASRALALARQ